MTLRLFALAGIAALHLPSLLAQADPVSVTTLGAACDYDTSSHPTDDAPVLQKILDGVIKRPNGSRYEFLSFPVGRCYIRQPLVIRDFALSLVGTGTVATTGLVADFARGTWIAPSKVALTLSPTAPGFTLGEKLQGFSISGIHNREVLTTGLLIAGPGNPRYIKGLNVSNLVLQSFDTCLQVTNTVQSTFDTLFLASCRVGLNLLGQDVNITVDRLDADAFTHANTPSTDPTFGVIIDQQSPSGPGPEGISLINSTILGADTNLSVGQVLQMTVLNDILDFSNHDTVVLRNPNGMQIHNCYISSVGKADAMIRIEDGTNLDGIDITDNFINGGNTSFGVFITGGLHRGLHLDRNRIQGTARAIQLNTLPLDSTISGNFGFHNTHAFITIADTSAHCGLGTRIESNTSTDALPILESHCSPAYSLGYNASPSQVIGK